MPPTQPRTVRDWPTLIEQLRRWAETHGSTLVSQGQHVPLPDGTSYPLGRRVKNLRDRYRRGTLDPWYVQQLEQVPGWVWTVRTPGPAGKPSPEWREAYDRVDRYIERHGSTRGMPTRMKAWVSRQRLAATNGDLGHHQVELLDRLGLLEPSYGLARTREYARLLEQYVRENELSTVDQVPHTATVPGPGGKDVPLKKRLWYYRERRQQLTDDEVDVLEAVPGWSWTSPRQG